MQHIVHLTTEQTGIFEGSHGYSSPIMSTFALCSCGWRREIANWEYPHSQKYVLEFYDLMHRVELLETGEKAGRGEERKGLNG